jgi:DNA helicase-2/ATP-dependent DNA helicase PcrA
MIKDEDVKGKTKEKLQQFINLINKAFEKYENDSAFEVTKFILDESGYLLALKEEKTEESRGRIENINEMLKAIDEAGNINEFIEHASLVMDNEVLESDFGGTVKIMTLHASKGLEFDLVFLPGWEEGIFPHQKALAEQGDKGLEEERRIAYVGITRAKKELFITYAESRRVFAEILNSLPSRFLAEIPPEICTKISSSNQLNYLGSKHSFYFQNNSPNNNKNQNISNHSPSSAIITNDKRPGSRVSHEKFGNGIIIKKDGDSLDIVFEKSGLKTIKESYVQNIKN